MKRFWKDRKAHLDEKKIAAKKQAAIDLRALMEVGDEDAYVALLRQLRPNITPGELVDLVEKFREYRRRVALGETIPS